MLKVDSILVKSWESERELQIYRNFYRKCGKRYLFYININGGFFQASVGGLFFQIDRHVALGFLKKNFQYLCISNCVNRNAGEKELLKQDYIAENHL